MSDDEGARASAFKQRVPTSTWAGKDAPWEAADTEYAAYMETEEGLRKVAR